MLGGERLLEKGWEGSIGVVLLILGNVVAVNPSNAGLSGLVTRIFFPCSYRML